MGVEVLVNIDTSSVELLNNDLVHPLNLTSYDKKWMSQLISASSNYNSHNSTSSNTNFVGSDDYIRLHFEDYLIGLLSTAKFSSFLKKTNKGELSNEEIQPYKDYDTNQLKQFNLAFIASWEKTLNYKLFDSTTDDHIFDVFEPKHVYAEVNHDYNSIKNTLTERLQMFKFENRKLDNEKKNKKGEEQAPKENLKLKISDVPEESKSKKSNSPTSKIWGWYNKNIKEK
jgi:hypothetical protein